MVIVTVCVAVITTVVGVHTVVPTKLEEDDDKSLENQG